MWISKKEYERLVERIGKIEDDSYRSKVDGRVALQDTESLRKELTYLREQVGVLIESLGLVYHKTPAKEAYIKKGGPERG
jgi:hypothetical protein